MCITCEDQCSWQDKLIFLTDTSAYLDSSTKSFSKYKRTYVSFSVFLTDFSKVIHGSAYFSTTN